MEIQGKVILLGEIRSGVNAQKGTDWASQDFVVEQEFQTPYGTQIVRVAVNLFGSDRVLEADLHVGDVVKVNYGINAREYQGKWYNDVRASRVEKLSVAQSGGQQAKPAVTQGQTIQPSPQQSVGFGQQELNPIQKDAMEAARAAFVNNGGDPNDLPF